MGITQKRRLNLQKEGLSALTKQGEPKFTDTWFPYTSGEIGPYYIQSVAVANNGEDYARAVHALCELIRGTIGIDNFDAVGGGESRDWDFSNPVAVALKKPHIKIYKDGKTVGDIDEKRIAWVADLNNEGSSMRDKWYPTMSEKGGRIVHAFFYVDRHEDGVNVMKDLRLTNDSIVPFDQTAWRILRDDFKYITPELYTSLMTRMENKKAWAHNALRTHIGQLEAMLKDPNLKTVAKAEKILNAGYHEIKDELIDMMRTRGYTHKFTGGK